ncbi:MAG TPA: hypothetical protein VGK62_02560 [Gaiellaceae bacterium]
MSVRRGALLAMLLAAIAATLCSTGPAVAADPAPLPPDQAQALATAPADTSGSTTRVVDGQTALNASAVPGAATSIESGVSAQAAVGLVPLTEGNIISASRPVCWANAAWHQWGTWPYQQRITDTTYWCAVYASHITYRTSTTTASGTLCGVSWRSKGLIAGGVGPGFTYFTNRSSAGFSCPTVIPWITIHTTHHEDVKRTDRGVTTFVGTG